VAKTDFAAKLRQLRMECDGPLAGGIDLVHLTPAPDPCLFAYQHRPELVLLCEWIERKEIRSYLEIGFYRGGLLSTLQALFQFERVAGCDEGLVQKRKKLAVSLPPAAKICWAKSESPEYRRFRHAMGKMDLVFIDGDHSYGGVRQDYEREKRQPHRFLAFHDIKNTEKAPGVVRLWNEIGGKKRELYVPRTVLDGQMRMVSTGDEMGIGIWSQTETP